MPPIDMNQYSTAAPLLRGFPAWINDPLEQQRIASYALYEAIYWSYPDTFKLLQRGSDSDPIYVPTGKQIVETINRYTAPGLVVAPDPLYGTPQEQLLATQVWNDFAARERFYSKFGSNKRYGIMRGDWLWHLYADPTKPEGSRISIFPLDPASYFPIYNPENVDEIIGCHIVEQVLSEDGKKVYIRRLTYRKATEMGGPSPITVSDMTFETDEWGGPGLEEGNPIVVTRAEETLPNPIDQLPVYLCQNFLEPGALYGSSEMRGLERLLAAVNQGITDEELSLVLDGLGVYVTNAGVPIDEVTGEEKPWSLGPGGVVELPVGENIDFKRVSGTTNVTPFQDHLKFLLDQIDRSSGTPAVAQGRVDVQAAESGIALMLELAPILTRGEEKELIITDVHRNMLFDLRRWFQAYEGGALGGLENVRWMPVYGPKVPPNPEKELDGALKLKEAKVVSGRWVRRRLTQIGFVFEADEVIEAEILAEQQVATDVLGARADAEVDQELQEETELGGDAG